MVKDLRFAFRMIASHRWFSASVIVTLALGIGINTTVFTLVNAALFAPVPIRGGDRIVTIWGLHVTKPEDKFRVSWEDYLEFKSANRSFEGIEAVSGGQSVISEAGNPPERFSMARVTPGLFPLIGAVPVAGRGFVASDSVPGAQPVVILGSTAWKNRYASDPSVVGRTVRIDGKPATVIGIMRDGLKFPNNEEFWMALVPDAELLKRSNHSLQLFGLLERGATIGDANAELSALAARIARDHPDSNKDTGAVARTFQETYNGGRIRVVFLTMLGAVGFVLLIACANVANMMLGRSLARGREFAVRAAIGATRWQLARQVLVESVVLSVLGGMGGLGLAAFGVHAFDLASRDVGKPYWVLFRMDWAVFAYFAAISVASGIVFGLLPALRSSRVDLISAMKSGTPGAGSNRGRLAASLVILQCALTVVLLAGAGMMVRSFLAAQEINSVVRPESLLTARVQLPEGKGERYADPSAKRRFIDTLLAEARGLPGVTAVSAANNFPGLGVSTKGIEIEGRPNPDIKQPPEAGLVVEAPNYLSTIDVPILVGRGLSETDGDPGREAAVVSRAFADKYWPDGSAVGRRLRVLEDDKPGAWMSVIGICADIVMEPGEKNPHPILHISYRQEPWGWMGFMLRTRSDPSSLAGPLRAAVQKIDQDLPLFEVATLTTAVGKGLWFLRIFGTLFAVFAAAGLLMASVGIYATVAQNTARRTREIGIRMSLGATAGGIARLVLSRGLAQLLLGLALGLCGALASTRLLDSAGFLIGTSARDPLVFAVVTVVLLSIGTAACWIPARRASRIAPVEALRTE